MAEPQSGPGDAVDALATVAGIALDASHRPGVAVNLDRIARMAGFVESFPLDPSVEAATVFRP